MFWLVIGYLFLFVFRPFEYWHILGVYHIERIYMIFLIVAILFWPKRRYIRHTINEMVLLFFIVMVITSAMALRSGEAYARTYDYLKLVVFYFIIIITIQDEDQLKKFLIAYILIMFMYVGKSAWEFFIHSRYIYRMGIRRMTGIDETFGDPNSFAATIVYSLPFLWALIKCGFEKKWLRVSLWAYGALALISIVFTGSRSGMVSTILFFILIWGQTRKKAIGIVLLITLLFGVWMTMPEKYKVRFQTIFIQDINTSADAAARGRIYTLTRGIKMFKKHPFFGVGPGNFTRGLELFGDYSGLSAHNLYGQLLGEMGLIGFFSYIFLIYSIILAHWKIIGGTKSLNMEGNTFFGLISVASIQAIILLFFYGNFGGNLYRYNWLWIGAIGALSSHFLMEFKEAQIEAENPIEMNGL